eukprot:2009629-Lingulodinium_polyedra.AAC.1
MLYSSARSSRARLRIRAASPVARCSRLATSIAPHHPRRARSVVRAHYLGRFGARARNRLNAHVCARAQ